MPLFYRNVLRFKGVTWHGLGGTLNYIELTVAPPPTATGARSQELDIFHFVRNTSDQVLSIRYHINGTDDEEFRLGLSSNLYR